jgi:nitrite reductase/ring-hydroxylating ferredoxin subunit
MAPRTAKEPRRIVPYVELIPLHGCRVDAGTFVERGGREFAVFRLTDPDRVVVVDNACPHAGGNLSAGDVVGGVVSCPWHQWTFELDTGVCTHSPLARVRRYEAELREGVIWVEIE